MRSMVEGLTKKTGRVIIPVEINLREEDRVMPENDYSFTGYRGDLKKNARSLRRNMTEQERRIWYGFLRKYPVRFYRQRVIDNYIVDFYCSKAKLVIELDGSQHYTPEGQEYDFSRTESLKAHKLEVLRISNGDVAHHFHEVCEYIDQRVKERMGE